MQWIVWKQGSRLDGVSPEISALLLASRVLLSGAKCKWYFACVRSVILYGSETWPVKQEDVIILDRKYTFGMVKLMCSVRPEDKISEELRIINFI